MELRLSPSIFSFRRALISRIWSMLTGNFACHSLDALPGDLSWIWSSDTMHVKTLASRWFRMLIFRPLRINFPRLSLPFSNIAGIYGALLDRCFPGRKAGEFIFNYLGNNEALQKRSRNGLTMVFLCRLRDKGNK